MNRLGVMTKEEIKAMMKATKDGSIVKKLQAEVNELKESKIGRASCRERV